MNRVELKFKISFWVTRARIVVLLVIIICRLLLCPCSVSPLENGIKESDNLVALRGVIVKAVNLGH